MVESV